jgi:nucleoside-diphosphate-sugar epimerase
MHIALAAMRRNWTGRYSMSDFANHCVITGATGYVGGRIRACVESAGWRTVNWSRRSGAGHVQFQLGQEVDPRSFAGAAALIHCAYDFAPSRWEDIAAINVRGSENLFRAALDGGVKQIIFISSASAFAGCRSLYGRAKVEIEALAHSAGATVIRPGLVYGDHPGGVFGKLVQQVKRSRLIPLMGGGHQPQYLVHDADLGRFVLRAIAGQIPTDVGPILLANEQAWTIRALLEHIAVALARNPVFIPVPWRAIWLGLKSMESLGLPAPFRSDSLLGLIYQNPLPSFATAKRLEATCRPFAISPAMLA